MTIKMTSSKPNTNHEPAKILVLAIGNDSRNDDGLGWAAAERLGGLNTLLEVEMRYQLQVEDAELISTFPLVIFVDATKEDFDQGYRWYQILPSVSSGMNTHALQPPEVLALCKQVYNKTPLAFVLAISGHKWLLKTGLSNKAKKNLEAASNFLSQWLKQADLHTLLADSKRIR